MLTIFKILGGRERCTGDDGKLDLFKRLALDTCALGKTLLGLLEDFTLPDSQSSRSQRTFWCSTDRLHNKLERYSMGTVRLPVEVESANQPLVAFHIQLLGRCSRRIERRVLIDGGYIGVFLELLIELATMGLKEPHLLDDLLVEIGLLLQDIKKLSDSTVSRHQNLYQFLQKTCQVTTS